MNTYLEGSPLVIMMALEEEYIYGNVRNANIYGLIVLSRRNYYR